MRPRPGCQPPGRRAAPGGAGRRRGHPPPLRRPPHPPAGRKPTIGLTARQPLGRCADDPCRRGESVASMPAERDVPYGLIDLASWAPPERRCRSRRYSWRSSAHHGPSALPARLSVSQGVRQEPGQAPRRRPGPALGGRACRGELLAGGEAASDRQGIGLATAARAAAHLARIERRASCGRRRTAGCRWGGLSPRPPPPPSAPSTSPGRTPAPPPAPPVCPPR